MTAASRICFRKVGVQLAACLLLAAPVGGQASDGAATFTVDVVLDEVSASPLQVTLSCGEKSQLNESATVKPGESTTFSIPVHEELPLTCVVGASSPPGRALRFLGDGGSQFEASDSGCVFSGVEPGHANFCQMRVEGRGTSLTVYKKWIGAERREKDVRIRLTCGGTANPEPKMINANVPGGWKLDISDPDGVVCEVHEEKRDDFVSDEADCQDLLILPGAREECTMVNTKVVKLIQMLNRYGLVAMILVFLAAGLVAVRKNLG
ncbi:MAG: hypothetical protein PVI22_02995 [Lysobacterales bacterium]|jgi:hypothetical protein